MASTDATPLPIKNTALRITFGMWLTTGLINSGAAGLDSEVSIDGGTYADCTNEATEIATSSGSYYLDLTAGETNGDTIAIQVKSSTTNAITYKITIYPSSGSKFQVNATQVGSQTASASGTVTFPNATLASTTNITAGTITTVTNLTNAPTNGDLTSTMKASVTTAATASTPTIASTQAFSNTGTWTGNIVGTVTTVTNLTNAASAGDFTATMKTSIGTAVAASAVASVTGNVGGNVTGSVGSVTGLTASNLDTAVSSRMATYVQPTGFLAANFTTGIPVSGTVVLTDGSLTAAKIAAGAIVSGTFAAGTTLPRVTLADTVTTVTGLTASNLDTTISSRAAAATALSTAVWTGTLATNLATTNASVVQIKAAVYDSATLSGSTLTLSNAATMTVTTSGRVTA